MLKRKEGLIIPFMPRIPMDTPLMQGLKQVVDEHLDLWN